MKPNTLAWIGAPLAIVALIVGSFAIAAGSSDPTSTEPHDPKLFLAGIGELSVVDVEAETVQWLEVPEIGAGDPPHLIAAVGNRLALWSYDVWSVPARQPGARPSRLAEDGWIFIPSANPDAIWVGFLAPGQRRSRGLGELREIDSRGDVLARGVKPPKGQWPYAALDDGLLFQEPGRIRLWDPSTERTIRTIPFERVGDAGPVDGNLLASCGSACRNLVLTDFTDGSQRRLPAPRGRRLVATEAEFSPDGSKLAIPVLEGTKGWRRYSEDGRRLAIIDLATGDLRLVRHSRVRAGYVFTAWSADGEEAFITGGGAGSARKLVSYRLGEDRAHRIDVKVGAFYDLVAE